MTAYWVEGPAEMSLNAICHRAEVSKPSVYREFGGEDGLTCAALDRYADKVLVHILAVLQGQGGFSEKIRRVAQLAGSDALHEHGCLFVKMRAARAQMGDQTRALIDEIETATLVAFAAVLAEGQANGDLARTISVDLAARYLQAQLSLALDMRARGEDPAEVLALALSVLTGPEIAAAG
jgi:AcrR family transcriptional regulator